MRPENVESSKLRAGALACFSLLLGVLAASRALPGADDSKSDDGKETQSAPHDYLRFVPGEPGEGELQTSIVTMVGEGGVEVDVISVVHVADGRYYGELQRRFESYDSLLYEMIKPDDVAPTPGEGGGGLLSFFQRGLKELLDLEFQLDGIDYTKKNFVHADLDPDTFFRLQRERGESLLSLMFKVMRAELANRQKQGKDAPPQLGFVQLALAFSSDDSARALKFLLAQQMEHMEALIAGIEDDASGDGSVIVAERNKVALKVLKEKLASGQKRLGIFYGGAHMPDMERRLVEEFHLKRSKEEWLTAWSIRKKGKAKEPRGLFDGFLSPKHEKEPAARPERRF